jgi:hypothetical protein
MEEAHRILSSNWKEKNEGTGYSACQPQHFQSPSTVNYPAGRRKLQKLRDPPGLGSEHSIPPGSKPHTTVRQLWRVSNPSATGWTSVSIVTHRQWDSLLTTEGRATNNCALHGPGSLLLNILHGSVSDSLPSTMASCDHLLPRPCGRVSPGSLTCDHFLFLGSQSSSVLTNTLPSQNRTGYSTEIWGVDLFSNAGLTYRRTYCHTNSPHWI